MSIEKLVLNFVQHQYSKMPNVQWVTRFQSPVGKDATALLPSPGLLPFPKRLDAVTVAALLASSPYIRCVKGRGDQETLRMVKSPTHVAQESANSVPSSG